MYRTSETIHTDIRRHKQTHHNESCGSKFNACLGFVFCIASRYLLEVRSMPSSEQWFTDLGGHLHLWRSLRKISFIWRRSKFVKIRSSAAACVGRLHDSCICSELRVFSMHRHQFEFLSIYYRNKPVLLYRMRKTIYVEWKSTLQKDSV